jgi:membrane protein required for colicin V production
MPSYLDVGVIAIVLISAVLAMVRGFTREVLAIASWGAAAVAAIYFHPLVLPYVKPYISKDTVALAAAAAIVFFATLIIVSIITVKVSDAILDSKVGPLDRSLGFIFGALRGLLLCVIAFAFFNWLVPQKAQPEWVKDAKIKPLLQSTGEQLMAMLPDDPEGLLNKLKKAKPVANEEAAPDSDTDDKLTPNGPTAAPAPAPATTPAPSPAPIPSSPAKPPAAAPASPD